MKTFRLLAPATLAVLLVAASTSPPPRLYVPNQDDATVSIIDIASKKVVETVDFRRHGFGDNAKPHHVQVEPDGSAWYVTLIGGGKVMKFDHNNKVLGSASMEVPGLIALHPTKDLMFVARSMSAPTPPPRLAIIRRSDMKIIDEVDLLFPRPHGVAMHPNGKRVYVSSLSVNQIASVGVDGGDVKLVKVPGPAHTFAHNAVSPNGRWLTVTAELTNQVMVFDLADPTTPKLVHQVPVPDAFESTFTGDSRWVFVSALSANKVVVVDTATWKVVDTISHKQFAQPHGLTVSANGQYVFLSNRHQEGGAHDHDGKKATGHGVLAMICAATRKVDTVLTVGNYAAGLGTPQSLPIPAPKPCR